MNNASDEKLAVQLSTVTTDRRSIRNSMYDEIRDYLKIHSAGDKDAEFSDDESLLEAGIIDSMTMVDIITFLEKTYSIVVDEDEMTPENFDNVNGIIAFVTSKRDGRDNARDVSNPTH